jgi:tryptophan synthase alpha chain
MNRLTSKLQSLQQEKRKALSIFLTAGFPIIEKTIPLVKAIENGGADILELGIPFSDPLADGPTIQFSSHVALENGITLTKIFSLVKEIRAFSEIPIVLMGYTNSVLAFGIEKFFSSCSESEIDGIIIPDLPIEESDEIATQAKAKTISQIFLATPTTTDKRLKLLDEYSSGFLYCVSITGVTGARKNLSQQTKTFLKRARKVVKKNPLLVGFGISSKEDAQQIKELCDGIIVGSALISVIQKSKEKEMEENVCKFVKELREGLIE